MPKKNPLVADVTRGQMAHALFALLGGGNDQPPPAWTQATEAGLAMATLGLARGAQPDKARTRLAKPEAMERNLWVTKGNDENLN